MMIHLVRAEQPDFRFQLRDALFGRLHLFPSLLAVPLLSLPVPVHEPAITDAAKA